MKVLLKEDVDNLGYAGEVMSVADGYGRNYLIPRGLAVKASPSVLKAAEKWRTRAAVRMAELQKAHQTLSDRLEAAQLVFVARAGETGKLYGSVTTADVVDKLNEELGTEIERRQVVGGSLRQLGLHKVTIRLSRDFQPQITVNIEPFDEEEIDEEEALEEAELAGGEAAVAGEADEFQGDDLDRAEEEDEVAEVAPEADDAG
jgi:large subunit ribosomal protein L9